MMASEISSKRVPWPAALGGVLLLPALLVSLAGVLNLDASNPLIHPFLVLGGLALAFGLNAVTVFRLGFQRDDAGFVGVVRVLARWPNLAIVAVSSALAASLLAYGFLENFRVIAR